MREAVLAALVVGSVGASGALASLPPIVVSPPPTTVTFGPNVSNGAPFSVSVTAVYSDSVTPFSLTLVSPPASVTMLGVSPASATSPAMFTVTGRVSYAANQSTVVLPFTVSDGVNAGSGSFTLLVVPEPATASMVGSGLMLLSRRRR